MRAIVLSAAATILATHEFAIAALQDGLQLKNVASATAKPTQAEEPRFLVRTARVPIFVDVDLGATGGAPVIPDDAADRVMAALDANPRRLITLRFKGGALRFQELPRSTREELLNKKGNGVIDAYNDYIAGQVRELINFIDVARTTAPIAVQGLPFEGRSIEVASANRAYAPVTERLNAFFVAGSMMLSGSSDEVGMLRRSYPQALAALNNRPILFAANGSWRIATAADAHDKQRIVAKVEQGDDDGRVQAAAETDHTGEGDVDGNSPILGSVAANTDSMTKEAGDRLSEEGTVGLSNSTTPFGSIPLRGGGGAGSASGELPAESVGEENLWNPSNEFENPDIQVVTDSTGDLDDPQPDDGQNSETGTTDTGGDSSGLGHHSSGTWEGLPDEHGSLAAVRWRPQGEEWESWESLRSLVATVPAGGTLDLGGRCFRMASDSSPITLSGPIAIRNGRFSAAARKDWESIGDGVFAAPMEGDLQDPTYWLEDFAADQHPKLGVFPRPAVESVQNDFRRAPSQDWSCVRDFTYGRSIDNGDVLTAIGDNQVGNTAKILGLRIREESQRLAIDRIYSQVGTELVVNYLAGANFTRRAVVEAWNSEEGVLLFSAPESQMYFSGYLYYSLMLPPAELREGEYCIQPRSNRVVYRPVSGDPTMGSIGLSSVLFNVLQGPVAFDHCGFYSAGNSPAHGGMIFSGQAPPPHLELRNCHFAGGNMGVVGCVVDVELSVFEQLHCRGIICYAGSRIQSSRVSGMEQATAIMCIRSNYWPSDVPLPQTTIRGNLISIPAATHGQGVSFSFDTWQNAVVEANIFWQTPRPTVLAGSSSNSNRVGQEFRFENNLIVTDYEMGVFPGGMAAVASTSSAGHVDIGLQRVQIRHNTLAGQSEFPAAFAMHLTTVGDVLVGANVTSGITSVAAGTGSSPHARYSNLPGPGSRWPSPPVAWGETDLRQPTSGGFDAAGLGLVGEYQQVSADGGPIGVWWAATPPRSAIASLRLDWLDLAQPMTLPPASNLSFVYASEDNRP